MIRFLLAALLLWRSRLRQAQLLDFTEAETRAILRHGPWPRALVARSEQPRLRQARGDRARRAPVLRAAPVAPGSVLCATCHAPFRACQDGRARAFGLARGRPQHAEPAQRPLPPLVRLGRRGRLPLGAERAADPRPARDGRQRAQAAALVRGDAELSCRLREGLRRAAARGRRGRAGRRRQGARRVPGDAGQRPHAVRRIPRCAVARRCFVNDRLSGSRAARAAHLRRQGQLQRLPFRAALSPTASSPIPASRSSSTGRRRSGPPRRHPEAEGERPQPARRVQRRSHRGASAHRDAARRAQHRNFGEFKVPVAAQRRAAPRPTCTTAAWRRCRRGEALLRAQRGPPALGRRALLKPLRLSASESADLVAFLESLTESASALEPRRPVAPCRR